MQQLCCDKQQRLGIFRQLTMMVKEEGLFRPLRGVNAMIAGAGPAHAMYFGCLETGKNFSAKFNLNAEVGDGKIIISFEQRTFLSLFFFYRCFSCLCHLSS